MQEYRREYPLFSLCGLNCGLCPRYQTQGQSKCPGCGGQDFHLRHPACAVISCNRKHDQKEYCFQCAAFPCPKYSGPYNGDSFISYRNVRADLAKAGADLKQYQKELAEKIAILEQLLANYNDGRSKNCYCLAVNLLPLAGLRKIMAEIEGGISKEDIPLKQKIEKIGALLESQARAQNIELKLRKQAKEAGPDSI